MQLNLENKNIKNKKLVKSHNFSILIHKKRFLVFQDDDHFQREAGHHSRDLLRNYGLRHHTHSGDD
jgi:hypothetical protein